MAEKPVQDYQQRLLRFVSDAVHDLVGPVDQVSSLVALFVRRYSKQLDDEARISSLTSNPPRPVCPLRRRGCEAISMSRSLGTGRRA